jgi:RluA family pseudouridine synthase
MDSTYQIIYEDDSIAVINKPSGLLSIPDGYNPALPCLMNELAHRYGRIWVVHRLDKLTSGIIIFAKSEQAHRNLNKQFSEHRITKNYRAIAHGSPIWQEKSIGIPLKVNGDRRHRTVPDSKGGKSARTMVNVIQKNQYSCYLDIFPASGLTHQIRAHLSCIGHPIVGDRLYWRLCSPDKRKIYQYPFKYDFMRLHAYSITFFHPEEGSEISFKCDPPAYFALIR